MSKEKTRPDVDNAYYVIKRPTEISVVEGWKAVESAMRVGRKEGIVTSIGARGTKEECFAIAQELVKEHKENETKN